MSRTVVHLLRHGKVHNPSGILYGRLPGYRLAASGRAMADGIADYLADDDITYVAASSLIRAQETATPVASRKGIDIVTDDRVIEAGNQFEGMKVAVGDGVLRQPRHWVKLRNPFLPSWGEPYLDIAHRMLGAIYTAVDAAQGHEALLVSHQLPIVTVRRYLEGLRLWHNPTSRECSVASLTSLTFDNGVFTGLKYTEPVKHIAAVDDDGVPQPGTTLPGGTS
jgi:broad specificity phosphatase PhoE